MDTAPTLQQLQHVDLASSLTYNLQHERLLPDVRIVHGHSTGQRSSQEMAHAQVGRGARRTELARTDARSRLVRSRCLTSADCARLGRWHHSPNREPSNGATRDRSMTKNYLQEFFDRETVVVRIAIATAPWFGSCESCHRELGYGKPELVGRPVLDEPNDHRWFCIQHLSSQIPGR